nr:MAG TPA: hypothetical protein [Caudoviricetes sp.]
MQIIKRPHHFGGVIFLCPKTPKGVRLGTRKLANIKLQKG